MKYLCHLSIGFIIYSIGWIVAAPFIGFIKAKPGYQKQELRESPDYEFMLADKMSDEEMRRFQSTETVTISKQ
jgi:hypothetical protein